MAGQQQRRSYDLKKVMIGRAVTRSVMRSCRRTLQILRVFLTMNHVFRIYILLKKLRGYSRLLRRHRNSRMYMTMLTTDIDTTTSTTDDDINTTRLRPRPDQGWIIVAAQLLAERNKYMRVRTLLGASAVQLAMSESAKVTAW